MANESRERLKEWKYSYKLKHKLEKEKKDNQEKSYLKIILFSPVLFLGFIGKVADSFKTKNNSYNKKLTKLDKNILSMPIIKENLKENNISNNNLNTMDEIEKYSYVYNKKDNYMLEEKIYLKFKKKIIELKNECEIIESEEYLLTKYENDNDLYIEIIPYDCDTHGTQRRVNMHLMHLAECYGVKCIITSDSHACYRSNKYRCMPTTHEIYKRFATMFHGVPSASYSTYLDMLDNLDELAGKVSYFAV